MGLLSGALSKSQIYMYLLRAVVMLIVIPFHEAAHALVSARLGDTTAKDAGRLSMNPLAHFDPMGALCMIVAGVGWAKPVGINPNRFRNPKKGMAISAAAGPVSNLMLAYLSMVLYKMVYYLAPNTAFWSVICLFFYYMVMMNISLAVFNLLPVPPWDGSRIVLVFLPTRTYFKIMKYERYIFVAFFVLLFFGFLDAPLGWMNRLVWRGMNFLTSYIELALNSIYA